MKYINGVNFAPFSPRGALASPHAKKELERMKNLTGANAVIFCPVAFQQHPYTEEIDFTSDATTADDELLDITKYAKSLGLRVFWKPTVNCADGAWRAHVNFFEHDVPNEPQWSGWFSQYSAFQTHFAKLAQSAELEMLILGCEMTNTERRETQWRKLIDDVREIYKGTVCYNCDKYSEHHITWWDAVDVIASSGYYPINEIEENLQRIHSAIEKYNKPFFFAEAGCMRIKGSAQRPNDWTLEGEPDDEEQARWYKALYAALAKNTSWHSGAALWDWPLDAATASPYAFTDAPALEVIRAAMK